MSCRTMATAGALHGMYVRTRRAIHGCDHDGKTCKSGKNHGCMVNVTVGPFVLQREYAL